MKRHVIAIAAALAGLSATASFAATLGPLVTATELDAALQDGAEAPVVLEGDLSPDKVVMMAFKDEAAARAFLEGPEYQAISEDRRAGATSNAIMIKGF